MKTTSIFTFFVLSIFTIPLFVNAQLEQSLIEQNLEINAEPEVPGQYTPVSLKIESYSTDLNRAEISWFLGGKLSSRGTGQKYFSFTTGKYGTVSTVDIRIKTAENRLIAKTLTFRPTHVSIVWEAIGYTPPFYRGKTIFTINGVIRAVALPSLIGKNGTVPETNLIYKWTKNGEVMGPLSGYGKNTITFDSGRLPEDTVIGVDVTTTDGALRAVGETVISPNDPKLVLYEEHPLYGTLLNTALKQTYTLMNEEVTIRAVPYFFSSYKNSDSIVFDWKVDGKTVGDSRESTLTLRPVAKGEGRVQLSVGIKDTDRLFQRASVGLGVAFGQKQNSGVFDIFR